MSSKVEKTDEEWRRELTPEQYHILREKGTERPWSGEYNDVKEKGVFMCAACGAELFRSDEKFESGSGWPSFYDVMEKGNVTQKTDFSHGMMRTEVLCGNCGAHLGHLFPDGPQPTGDRYCMNSASLRLEPAGDPPDDQA